MTTQVNPQILLNIEDLRSLGINYHVSHLRRMEDAGHFPERVRLSANKVAWVREEVVAWLDGLTKARVSRS